MGASYKNRAEIRAYFETHEVTLKELERMYGVSYRTLTRWRVSENWKPKRAVEKIQVEVLNDELTQHGVETFLGAKKQEIKEAIKENLKHIEIDPIVLECITETSSDELLLQAMNLHFINKNILLAAIIAKDELLKMVRNNLENAKGNPVIIAAAEKVAKMFSDLKISLYGKESFLSAEPLENDYSKMTTQELLKIASEPQT